MHDGVNHARYKNHLSTFKSQVTLTIFPFMRLEHRYFFDDVSFKAM